MQTDALPCFSKILILKNIELKMIIKNNDFLQVFFFRLMN